MSSWAVVAIVAIAIWGFVSMYRAKHGIIQDENGNQSSLPRGDDGATLRELEELRDRVKTLERITVDSREAKAIADEIERLRDR